MNIPISFNSCNYNYLHLLNIAADGKLTEPGDPVQIPVPATVRLRGVVVWKIK
jgi:hypothetical protein